MNEKDHDYIPFEGSEEAQAAVAAFYSSPEGRALLRRLVEGSGGECPESVP